MMELQVDRDEAFLQVDSGPGRTRRLRIGSLARIHQGLQAGQLSASQLEEAIAEIEDLIMPVLRTVEPTTPLRVTGPVLETVLKQLGSADKAAPISAVEDLFNRLADVAGGAPSSRLPVASHPDFVLGLVLLREVMHHGGFTAVTAK